MILYGYFRSSAAWRCRIAFNLKGLGYEFRPVHLRRREQRTPDYLALNPQGLVPTLVVGDLVLNQSLAIIEWLDETFPDVRLIPEDRALRARVRAFALDISADTHPLQNVRVLNDLERRFGADQAVKDTWCGAWIRPALQGCEAVARRQTHGGAFTFGDTPSLADICLVPQLASADRFHVDISDLTRLAEIRAACEALPAFAEAVPGRQPDAEA
ncbi:UNVERIFIED_ORG: maleylacetoacetate isomerase [Xanthobacter viscosus]|jgi:maleylacetoacetate isomerase|uniref:Maleylacetoacetate isomerase n=1 Tax=Xanthobacter autotrophicus TaxID=280 RepID=A0A6C1KGL6_XANAU|nr:maleylacetoacetate isomerase [Xanthobacter autotrophicus]TLX43412.1 maleylacetoacetate isomerase [Xanthobacter autotrophicus]